jgi:hypothetical protein
MLARNTLVILMVAIVSSARAHINNSHAVWSESPTPAPAKYHSAELIDINFVQNMSEELLWQHIEIQPAKTNGTYSFFSSDEKEAVKSVSNWMENLVDWVATQAQEDPDVQPYATTSCKTATTITTSDNNRQSTWAA